MDLKLTPAQKEAVSAEEREILVSASAGSGKTEMLVQRVVRMLKERGKDPGHLFPYSIRNMLIVTFTRAAAGEMRTRLESTLTAEAAWETDPVLSEHLCHESDCVALAQISTLHSFCSKVLHEYFQYVEPDCGETDAEEYERPALDPKFTILDDREKNVLYQECVDEAMDALYTRALSDADAGALCDAFPEKDLREMLNTLYQKAESQPNIPAWLKAKGESGLGEGEFQDSDFWRILRDEMHRKLDCMKMVVDRAEEECPVGLHPKLEENLQNMRELCEALERSFDGGPKLVFEKGLDCTFPKLVGIVKPPEDVLAAKNQLAKRHKELKKIFEEYQKDARFLSETAQQDIRDTAAYTRALSALALDFHCRFTRLKLEEAKLDYNDLEHYTLQLMDNDGVKASLSGRFDAVFVDEYQDISYLQDAVLSGLNRDTDPEGKPPQSIFYVGDVKQSIYRFRQAEPKLFLEKYERFHEKNGKFQRLVILAQNFRSTWTILDGVNRVFAYLMKKNITDIEYDDEARMVCDKSSCFDYPVELCLLGEDKSRPDNEGKGISLEAHWLARDIRKKCTQHRMNPDGTPGKLYEYKDIAILMPTVQNVAETVNEILEDEGIPVYSQDRTSGMNTEESRQVLNWLTLLSDTTHDISLLAVLRGPLFSLTEEELAMIRLCDHTPGTSFHHAFEQARVEAPEPLRSKLCEVAETIEKERFLLSSMPMGEYLWGFLRRSGLYRYYGTRHGGEMRQANLRLLCLHADEFDESEQTGVRGFVERMTGDEQVKSKESPALLDPWDNVVTLETIHKSKGLQYPIVYVLNLSRDVIFNPSNKKLWVHSKFGIAPFYMNRDQSVRRKTILQRCIELADQKDERSEKVRLLYVAMTRASERLILVGHLSEKEQEQLPEPTKLLCPNPHPELGVMGAECMLDWLMDCLKPQDQVIVTRGVDEKIETEKPGNCSQEDSQKELPWQVRIVLPDRSAEESDATEDVSETHQTAFPGSESVSQENEEPCGTDPLWLDPKALPWQNRAETPEQGKTSLSEETMTSGWITSYESPEKHRLASVTAMPRKVGVTALCRAIKEGELPAEQEETAETKRYPLGEAQPRLMSSVAREPAFLSKPSDVNVAIQRGVQTHRVLGLLDLQKVRDTDPDALPDFVKAEIAALTAGKRLRPEEAAYADPRLIVRFLRSDMAQRMLKSPCCYREKGFTLESGFQGQSLLIQGVIDLCFLEDENWVLVDYKTDRIGSMEELLERYRDQLRYYRRALEESTPYPVKETGIFSLQLGEYRAY